MQQIQCVCNRKTPRLRLSVSCLGPQTPLPRDSLSPSGGFICVYIHTYIYREREREMRLCVAHERVWSLLHEAPTRLKPEALKGVGWGEGFPIRVIKNCAIQTEHRSHAVAIFMVEFLFTSRRKPSPSRRGGRLGGAQWRNMRSNWI